MRQINKSIILRVFDHDVHNFYNMIIEIVNRHATQLLLRKNRDQKFTSKRDK